MEGADGDEGVCLFLVGAAVVDEGRATAVAVDAVELSFGREATAGQLFALKQREGVVTALVADEFRLHQHPELEDDVVRE